jgi:hypothetical protein
VNIIDSYQFGFIVVSGKKYASDVIIFPDSVRDNWRRKVSHQVLVVGTGAAGLMKVLPEVHDDFDARSIKLIVEATDQACHTYNQLCHSQRVVAALHLTC